MHVPPGVHAGLPDHLLEQIGADQTGAGEGGQHPARPQELHPQQVHVLVATQRSRHLPRRGGELRRIKDDYVELPSRLPIAPQYLKHVP